MRKSAAKVEAILRNIKLRLILRRVARENKELLSRLNDYDENGTPYWEKWNKND